MWYIYVMLLIRFIELTVIDNLDIIFIFLLKGVFLCFFWNKRLKYMFFILYNNVIYIL